MPSAADIAKRLLEDEEIDWAQQPGDPDAATPQAVDKFTGTQEFDEWAADTVLYAQALYKKCQRSGLLATVEKSGVDHESITQALIRLAIEERGNPNEKRAYRLFRQYGKFEL